MSTKTLSPNRENANPDDAIAELLTHFSPARLANISETSADVVGASHAS